MSDCTGGLPPSAHARLDKQRGSQLAGSLFSAAAAASARAAGLEPMGEVFGCLVMNLGWTNGGCGQWWNGGYGSRGLGGNWG